ncbi:exodeoxyribonuclease III [Blattabacterium cuenoti]|uniref:exodeoxyribonuclease III n=1 Tax=Blattabacterium cuenoti TaxID=1653831 RepID=UPI00163D0B92|nr:exodeoxyribonuclease III [Blattabacterium cuenoti]
MKIISYNINGIRSVIRKGFQSWISNINPDVLCLQEIKATHEQIDINLFYKLGYYCYWFPSKKKGYSGVAILSKKKPFCIKYGMDLEIIDKEGRILCIDLYLNNKEKISIISLYLPSGNDMKNRLNFKLFFMKKFFMYIKNFEDNKKNLIICGDYNICHSEIDINDPIKNENISGFLKEERKWMTNFIKLGFIDSFRHYIKKSGHYSWWNYRFNSRKYNKGWRIDYILISVFLKKYMKNAYLLPYVKYSDHCPMVLELNID